MAEIGGDMLRQQVESVDEALCAKRQSQLASLNGGSKPARARTRSLGMALRIVFRAFILAARAAIDALQTSTVYIRHTRPYDRGILNHRADACRVQFVEYLFPKASQEAQALRCFDDGLGDMVGPLKGLIESET